MRRLVLCSLLALCLLPAFSSPALAKGACLTECAPRFGIVSAFGAEGEFVFDYHVDPEMYQVAQRINPTEANSSAVTLAFLAAWADHTAP